MTGTDVFVPSKPSKQGAYPRMEVVKVDSALLGNIAHSNQGILKGEVSLYC